MKFTSHDQDNDFYINNCANYDGEFCCGGLEINGIAPSRLYLNGDWLATVLVEIRSGHKINIVRINDLFTF